LYICVCKLNPTLKDVRGRTSGSALMIAEAGPDQRIVQGLGGLKGNEIADSQRA
jgi:hypothetical protein